MKHVMRLHPSPFERIKSGKKVVEGRLNDNKRRMIEVGDEIEFVSRESREIIKVIVTRIEKQNTFAEMYDKTDLKDWAWSGTIEEFVNGFYKYYSKEDEKEFGTISIYFKLLC